MWGFAILLKAEGMKFYGAYSKTEKRELFNILNQ